MLPGTRCEEPLIVHRRPEELVVEPQVETALHHGQAERQARSHPAQRLVVAGLQKEVASASDERQVGRRQPPVDMET